MMPLCTFKCPSCNRVEEIRQSMKAASPVCQRCVNASCGIHIPEMKRVYGHTTKPQFKGDGFYETDYKKKDDDISMDRSDSNS